MTEPVRLCKDCRWAVNVVAGRGGALPPSMYFECHHPSAVVTEPPDLVTGAPTKPAWEFCSHHRSSTVGNRCGPEGRFWEPKDDDPEFSGVIGFGEALTSDDL
jgi:hypothetical protein